MAALLTPVLTTPLLKVPILLTDAALTWIAFTPPNPPPPSEEQASFTKPDLFTRTHKLQMKLVVLSKVVICAVLVAEAATALAQQLPSSISDCVLSVLAPGQGHPPLSLQFSGQYILGASIALAGGAVRAWSYRTLGRFFTWQLSVKNNHKLVTEGPYAWVRHPSYTGFAMVLLGNYILCSSPGSYFAEMRWDGLGLVRALILGSFAYVGSVGVQILTRVNKEDAVLHEKFGEEWEAWARTTYRLIPYIY
ncbi:hypothetical protein BD413DRAFT_609980 [Trametes elegans]|nr:hypothetical protein BD413DRAFT_609980 [Trametes elegans]